MSCGCVVSSPQTLWEDEVGFVLEPVFSYVGSVSNVVYSSPGRWFDSYWWYRDNITSGPKDKVSLKSAGAMTSNSVLTYSTS
jgi:hypothetical protein